MQVLQIRLAVHIDTALIKVSLNEFDAVVSFVLPSQGLLNVMQPGLFHDDRMCCWQM